MHPVHVIMGVSLGVRLRGCCTYPCVLCVVLIHVGSVMIGGGLSGRHIVLRSSSSDAMRIGLVSPVSKIIVYIVLLIRIVVPVMCVFLCFEVLCCW